MQFPIRTVLLALSLVTFSGLGCQAPDGASALDEVVEASDMANDSAAESPENAGLGAGPGGQDDESGDTVAPSKTESDAQSAADAPHPIDIAFEACAEKENWSTYGMHVCGQAARDAWDALLNEQYALLMSRLTEDEQAYMRASQRSWLAFRDAENEALGEIFGTRQGTMWGVVVSGFATDLVKSRALDLQEINAMWQ